MNALEQWIILLADAFGTQLGKTRLQIYKQQLAQPLESVDLNVLFTHCVRKCRYFPTIAEIIDIIQMRPAPRERANMILTRVRRAIAQHGSRGGAYEAMGPEAAHFVREVMGVSSYDLAAGIHDLSNPTTYAQWRDQAEAHFKGEEREDEIKAITAPEATAFLEEVQKRTGKDVNFTKMIGDNAR